MRADLQFKVGDRTYDTPELAIAQHSETAEPIHTWLSFEGANGVYQIFEITDAQEVQNCLEGMT